MQALSTPISSEVLSFATRQREKEFYAVNAEAEKKWWHKLGAKVLNIASNPETNNVDISREVISTDEIIDRAVVEQLAWQLIDNYEPTPKLLRLNEAEDNARTAIFEALTASGHMSVVELKGDPHEVHEQVLQRLLNSYFRVDIPDHERARNFEEICEELVTQVTFERIQQGHVPPETKINTLSDFAHPLGVAAQKLGYRPSRVDERKGKGMAREVSFEEQDGSWVRIIKQISRNNSFAPDTISKLQKAGLRLPKRSGEADVQLLGTQMLSVSHGAIEVVQLLDRLERGHKVMYGEPVTAETIPYEKLEKLSHLREAEVEFHVKDLADYERRLDDLYAEGKITEWEQRKMYAEALREHVRSICVRFPAYTRGALGEKVVDDYRRAHKLFKAGDMTGVAGVVGGASRRETAVLACGLSTSAENIDSNNPDDSRKQVLQSILGRSAEEHWEGEATCPFCHKHVHAVKSGGYMTGSCGHWLEICTGKSGFIPPDDGQNADESSGVNTTSSEINKRDFDSEFQAIIEQNFGEGAVAEERIEVGGTRTDILTRNGEVIASNVKLGQLALARN